LFQRLYNSFAIKYGIEVDDIEQLKQIENIRNDKNNNSDKHNNELDFTDNSSFFGCKII